MKQIFNDNLQNDSETPFKISLIRSDAMKKHVIPYD